MLLKLKHHFQCLTICVKMCQLTCGYIQTGQEFGRRIDRKSGREATNI
jgi:hypothetical protein